GRGWGWGGGRGGGRGEGEAAGVDDAQADLIVSEVDLSEDLPDLIGSEHDGERVRLRWADQLQQWPGALKRALEEELDRAQRHGTAGARCLLLVAQVREVLPQLFVAEHLGRLAVVESQLSDVADVGLLGA